MIVVCPIYPENLGLLVEVIHARCAIEGDPAWQCNSLGRPIVGRCENTGQPLATRSAGIPDAALRPIRPQPDAEETLRDEPAELDHVA